MFKKKSVESILAGLEKIWAELDIAESHHLSMNQYHAKQADEHNEAFSKAGRVKGRLSDLLS